MGAFPKTVACPLDTELKHGMKRNHFTWKEDIMEYLLKHSPIKIKEFLTESAYTTPETISNTLSRNGSSRGYVILLKNQN